jgi:hypothetical protein
MAGRLALSTETFSPAEPPIERKFRGLSTARYGRVGMTRAIYQVRLIVKPEYEDEFNAWYEGTYMPKLMRETPHFTAAHRYQTTADGDRLYVTEYETTSETMAQAIAEMRAPSRAADNAQFYQWKERAITLHESLQLHERLYLQ